jgi:predicted nucleic acid-binding protein
MKSKVYIDTSVISALFDIRSPERMTLTKTAWEQLTNYDVYISEIVLKELSRAKEPLRTNMFNSIESATVLPLTETAQSLAGVYVQRGIFPEKFSADALHVAIASTHQIGILLSWNFSHLVKLKTRRLVTLVNTIENYVPVEIISPPEL